MNQIANIQDAQMPAYLQGYDEPEANDLVTQNDQIPTISIRGKQFRRKIPGEQEQALPLGADLAVVILAADPPGRLCARKFYLKAFNPDAAEAPDCSSSDGVFPDEWIGLPQSQSCAACLKSAWGSAVDANTGEARKGKACSDVKNLLIVPSDGIAGLIYKLTVPPTSLSNLSDYGRQLAKQKIPMEAVITVVNFAGEATQPVLTFRFGGFLTAEDGPQAIARAHSDEVKELVHIAPAQPPVAVALPETNAAEGVSLVSQAAPAQETVAQQQPIQETVVQQQPAATGPAPTGPAPTGPAPTGWGAAPETQAAPAQTQAAPAQTQAAPAQTQAAPAQTQHVAPADGAIWSPIVHATGRDTKGPVLNADNTFRRKRGITTEFYDANVTFATQPAQPQADAHAQAVAQEQAQAQAQAQAVAQGQAAAQAQVVPPAGGGSVVEGSGDLNSVISNWGG